MTVQCICYLTLDHIKTLLEPKPLELDVSTSTETEDLSPMSLLLVPSAGECQDYIRSLGETRRHLKIDLNNEKIKSGQLELDAAFETSDQKRLAAIFNEWARRYAEDPSEFGEILDSEGKAVAGCGERCALYFEKIAADLNAAASTPVPPPA